MSKHFVLKGQEEFQLLHFFVDEDKNEAVIIGTNNMRTLLNETHTISEARKFWSDVVELMEWMRIRPEDAKYTADELIDEILSN